MRYIDMPPHMKAAVQRKDRADKLAAIARQADKWIVKAQRHADEFVMLYAERECKGDASGRLTRRMGVEKAEAEAICKVLADAGVEFSPIYSLA